jgi:predicted dehydrogenase
MLCMDQGKHIYVEKPMCRTFHEAELMMDCARRHPGVATQVGNQGHSDANYFQFKAWLDAGIIKDVTAVTAHMNNSRRWHGFDAEKMFRMPEEQPIPKNMDWDTWLGTIPYLEYNEKYHQGNWRCWYDTGMGCLGDWGAHILDTVHEFLELGLPYEISMLYEKGHNDYFFPYSSTILFRFPARKGMPPVDVTWYDGLDNLPPLPAGYGGSVAASDVPASSQNSGPEASLAPGKIIYSRDLTFKGASHGSTLSIIPEEAARDMAGKLPEVPKSPSNHFENFLLACQGKEKTRSPFEINGVISEVFCLGVIAQRLNTQLFFDTRTKQFTNNEFANALLTGLPPRRGWEQFYKM